MKNFLSLVLSLSMVFAMSVCASAAEISSDGGFGITPVYLSSTEDGTMTGEPSATAMSVTVPTAFPMAMSQMDDVTTADNCQIINNSYGAVRVRSVTISAENGWKLTAFGDKSTLASEKVDSDQLGFAICVGDGEWVMTDSSDKSTQDLIYAPIAGCYISGIGNAANNSVSVYYRAIVTPLSSAVINANIANIVFVIEWDTAA